MKKNEKISILSELAKRAESILLLPRFTMEYHKWYADAISAIANIFGDGSRQIETFKSIIFAYSGRMSDLERDNLFHSGLSKGKAQLLSYADEVLTFGTDDADISSTSVETDAEQKISTIITRFHKVARQLTNRYDRRGTLSITDEYDVQDLLHALLKIDFDDIRPEEATPSTAGTGSRMDFLINDHKIVIEVKKTRTGLGQKEVADQLIIDKERYKTHPNCKLLICFVYDPDGKISNPVALENDLSEASDDFSVKVIVCPK